MLNTIPKVNHESLKIVLDVVRKVTKIIKLFPFLYIVLFIAIIPFETFGGMDIVIIFNLLFFESPLFVALLVLLSYCVKLCFWHRLQCILPLIPQLLVYCDQYIYEYGEALATINFIMLLLLFILSLVNAYFVFIRPSNLKSK